MPTFVFALQSVRQLLILLWRRSPVVLSSSCWLASQCWGRLQGEWETDERQREMAEGKEEWTGSRATLETNLMWPWSSRAVGAVKRVQNREISQRHVRRDLLIRVTFINRLSAGFLSSGLFNCPPFGFLTKRTHWISHYWEWVGLFTGAAFINRSFQWRWHMYHKVSWSCLDT